MPSLSKTLSLSLGAIACGVHLSQHLSDGLATSFPSIPHINALLQFLAPVMNSDRTLSSTAIGFAFPFLLSSRNTTNDL